MVHRLAAITRPRPAELPPQTGGLDAQEGERQQHQQSLDEDMLEQGCERGQGDADKDRKRERAGPLPSQPGQTGERLRQKWACTLILHESPVIHISVHHRGTATLS